MTEQEKKAARREFDLDTHDRMVRMEEKLGNHVELEIDNAARRERQDKHWCGLLEDHKNALLDLDEKVDEIILARARERGALGALLWAGGLLFTAATAVSAWFYRIFHGIG